MLNSRSQGAGLTPRSSRQGLVSSIKYAALSAPTRQRCERSPDVLVIPRAHAGSPEPPIAVIGRHKPTYTNANFPTDVEGRTYHLGTKVSLQLQVRNCSRLRLAALRAPQPPSVHSSGINVLCVQPRHRKARWHRESCLWALWGEPSFSARSWTPLPRASRSSNAFLVAAF